MKPLYKMLICVSLVGLFLYPLQLHAANPKILKSNGSTWEVIAFQAEDYDAISGDWAIDNETDGYRGIGYMLSGTEGQVHYHIDFDQARTYYIYFRTYSPDHLNNGCHLSVDNTSISEYDGAHGIYFTKVTFWKWGGQFQYPDNTHVGPVWFEINTAGVHTVKLRVRETGWKVDEMIISKDKIGPDSYTGFIDQCLSGFQADMHAIVREI